MTLREVNRVGEGQKNIPKLRFKGYEDAWEQRKLGDIFKYEQPQPYIVTSTKYDDKNDIPVLTAGQSFILGYTDEQFGVKEANENNPVIIFDDFTTSSHYVDFPFKVKSSAMKLLSLNNQNDNIHCAYNALKNVNYIPVSHERHWISTFAKVDVFMPKSADEQKLIGTYLVNLDYLITLHQRKYDALKAMKKTLLSKMFPKNGEDIPEIRFKGFTNAWEQRKLGALVQFVNGRAYKQEELLDVGKYKVVRVGNFNTNEKWYFSDLELETDKYIDNGDLLYLWATSFGPVIWQGEKAIFHYHIWKLKNFESLDKKYLYSFLEWDKNKISQNTNGSTMVHITKNMIEQRDIEYPTKSEQYRIGSLLESIDKLITLHQRKLDELKNMKKTLLQQMFV